jgi:hypothetical protein
VCDEAESVGVWQARQEKVFRYLDRFDIDDVRAVACSSDGGIVAGGLKCINQFLRIVRDGVDG